MSIRFAAARPRLRHQMAARQALAACRPPANDNTHDNAAHRPDRAVLHAALRHFANHGMAAASEAATRARAAAARGDQAESTHWLEICRLLDRRLARHVEGGR